MVELCGARLVPGTLDAYPSPAEPRVVPLRPERLERLLGERIDPERGRRDPRPARLRARSRTAAGDGAALARRRRAARGRPDRGGRPHPRPRQAADHAAGAPGGRGHAHAAAAAAPPARGRAARPRPERDASRTRFTSPAALARLRLDDEPLLRLANPLSEDQSVMRPLLLPGLLDAARHNAAHGRAELRAVRVGARVPPVRAARRRPGGPPERRHAGRRAPPPRRRSLTAASRRAGAPRAAPPTTTPPGRCSRRCSRPPASTWRAEPGERPFLHPGRQASVLRRRRAQELGWIGELHPRGGARVGARGAGGRLRARRRRARRAARSRRATAT